MSEHASDCAVHSEPAFPAGPCNCGAEGSAANVREGFEVEFECGHRAVYDRHSQHGIPEIGQLGRCHRCHDLPEPNPGVDRRVVGLRQCWIETTTRVLFERPKS